MASASVGRLIFYDDEAHFKPDVDSFAVGDVADVIRGNGPREGEHMGTAVIDGIENGVPTFDIRFDG